MAQIGRDIDHDIERAASVLREAEALLITAGAGMGVDSGLPDFRGTEGFWKAYPAIARFFRTLTLAVKSDKLATHF